MSSFIDSNIFIYAFVESKYSKKCKGYINDPNEKIINTLILIEVYAGLLKITKNKEYAIKVIKGIMKRHDIKIVDFDINLVFETMKRLIKYNIKFNDVTHYVTALLSGCSGIISYDKHFDDKNFELKRYEP